MNYEITPLYSEVAPNLFMGGTDDSATIDQAQVLLILTEVMSLIAS